MAYCSECGSELKDGAKFCGACGAPVRASVGATAPESAWGREQEPVRGRRQVREPELVREQESARAQAQV